MKKENEMNGGLEATDPDDVNFSGIGLVPTGQYIIKIISTQKISTPLICQLEYMFKKSIGPLEEFRKIEVTGVGMISITYFGDLSCISKFTEKIKPTPFSISDICFIAENGVEE